MQEGKVFYLIAGPNGSGKTTFAKHIINHQDVIFLNADKIAADMKISNIGAARILLKDFLPRALGSGHSFALETTLSGTGDLNIIKMAKNHEYKIVFIFTFLASAKQSIERVAHRVRDGGHNVASDDIMRRYEKSLNNFAKICPFADVWQLFYNGGMGEIQNVASGTQSLVNVMHTGYYDLFIKQCNDAFNGRLCHFSDIGADASVRSTQKVMTWFNNFIVSRQK